MNIGGKAQSLQKLKSARFNVPDFFVCDDLWDEKKVRRRLDKKFPNVNYFAVRSSASAEDSEEKSYAGHFYSAVGAKKDDVFQEIRNVLTSFRDLDGSVIVQEFVASEFSGIAFSDNGDGIVIINSNFGLCKNVVEGKACDEYFISDTGVVVRKNISKDKPVLYFRDGKFEERVNSEESLTSKQIKQVVELVKNAEKHFNTPQDIEWCFKDQSLYLLQSRPVTKKIEIAEQEYFDSANIAESYSGIVLPLTASFAQRIYKVVYKDFLRMSGVSKTTLRRHAYVFENLLGFFHGRMYYNMNNWYRLAQFVPGYSRNKKNFETMITSSLRQEIATAIKPNKLFTFAYPVIVLLKFIVFRITETRFRRYIQKHIKKLRKTNFDNLTLEECSDLFNLLENDLLRKWYVTLENDFFVMTYLGILQKLYPKENLQVELLFRSKATEQVGYLVKLTKQIQGDQDLWKAMKSGDGNKFEMLLNSNQAIKDQYEEYIREFGGRFANELKLETVGIDEDIEKLMTVLRAYEAYIPKQVEEHEDNEVLLPLAKRIMFKHFLKKFKRYASQREDFRLLRSNMFSITRSVFRRVGVILENQGVLNNLNEVFYMSIEEVLALAKGQEVLNLSQKITDRKKRYAQYQNENPPSHFLTFDGQMTTNISKTSSTSITRGVSAGIVSGRVKVMKNFEMPDKIDFEILVTKHTDPGWTALIALSKGLIIEHGGILSHASIVARELGVPAVIGVKDATDIYKDGQKLEIDGSTGKIKIL